MAEQSADPAYPVNGMGLIYRSLPNKLCERSASPAGGLD